MSSDANNFSKKKCAHICCPNRKIEKQQYNVSSPSSCSSSDSDTRKLLWNGTLAIMNVFAKLLLWSSIVATIAAVIWYSIELKQNG